MDTMPSTYDSSYNPEPTTTTTNVHHVETTRTTTTSDVPIGFNVEYIRTLPAILKIVEVVLNIIILICIGVVWGYHASMGWSNFVAVLTMLLSLFFFIVYLLNLIYRLPGPWVLIEFICWVVSAVLLLIALICIAVIAGGIGGLIAACVFIFFNIVAYGIDAFFSFTMYRTCGAYITTGATASTTTTTSRQEAYVTQ